MGAGGLGVGAGGGGGGSSPEGSTRVPGAVLRRGWRVIRESSLSSVEEEDEGRGWWRFVFCCHYCCGGGEWGRWVPRLVGNTRPFGNDAAVGLAMSLLLLADMCLSFLTLLQCYSVSLLAFWIVLLFLPLTPLFSAAAGLNALFSHGPKAAPGLGRVYGLWNVTSMANPVAALVWGFIIHRSSILSGSTDVELNMWWIFPSLMLVVKVVQAWVVDIHVANLDIHDRTLFSDDPAKFWQS